jgi:hypothetical protein
LNLPATWEYGNGLIRFEVMEGRATHTRRSHLFVRRCVCCGYESRALDDGAACIRCGCDLTERPPRSYAEMEGLLDAPAPRLPHGPPEARWLENAAPPIPLACESEGSRTMKRWMLFLLLSMLLLITIAALAAAALGA